MECQGPRLTPETASVLAEGQSLRLLRLALRLGAVAEATGLGRESRFTVPEQCMEGRTGLVRMDPARICHARALPSGDSREKRLGVGEHRAPQGMGGAGRAGTGTGDRAQPLETALALPVQTRHAVGPGVCNQNAVSGETDSHPSTLFFRKARSLSTRSPKRPEARFSG